MQIFARTGFPHKEAIAARRGYAVAAHAHACYDREFGKDFVCNIVSLHSSSPCVSLVRRPKEQAILHCSFSNIRHLLLERYRVIANRKHTGPVDLLQGDIKPCI